MGKKSARKAIFTLSHPGNFMHFRRCALYCHRRRLDPFEPAAATIRKAMHSDPELFRTDRVENYSIDPEAYELGHY